MCTGFRTPPGEDTQSALSRGAEAAATASITSPASISGVKSSSPSRDRLPRHQSVWFSYPHSKVNVLIAFLHQPSLLWFGHEGYSVCLVKGFFFCLWNSLVLEWRAGLHSFQV